jgi:hypothetical protein
MFGVYCRANDKAYLVPVEHIGKRLGSLRIERTLNNQAQRIRWAGEYEIGPDSTRMPDAVPPTGSKRAAERRVRKTSRTLF